MKRKQHFLGTGPLTPAAVLQDLGHGGRDRQLPEERAVPLEPRPAIRKTPSTTTPGGRLRKTIYFTESEWRAIKAKAYQEDRPYTDIVREAIQVLLGLPPEEA